MKALERTGVAVGVAVLLGSAVAASSGASAAEAVTGPKVTWNASLWGKEREVTQAIEGVAAYVRDKTGGNFTIKLHYGEALSDSKENLDGLKIGAFEAGMICAGYHPGKNPSITVLELPFTFNDLDEAERAHEAVFAHPYVRQEMERWNARLLMGSLIPPQVIVGKGKPLRKIEDYQGKRIRAVGALAGALKALGAVATSVPAAETFTAMDRGMMDAAVFTIGSAFSFGLAETMTWYTTNFTLGAPTCPVVISNSAFNALPAAYQKLVMDAKRPAYDRIKNAWKASDERNLPKLKDRGVEAVAYAPEQLREIKARGAKPVWDEWIKTYAAQGVPAQELFDLMMKSIEGK